MATKSRIPLNVPGMQCKATVLSEVKRTREDPRVLHTGHTIRATEVIYTMKKPGVGLFTHKRKASNVEQF